MPTIGYAITADAQLADAKLTGRGHCRGGRGPALHNYPLLAWTHLGHPKYGSEVFTEDQAASAAEIAAAAPESPSLDALAARFGTSVDHVVQALDFAVSAGYLTA